MHFTDNFFRKLIITFLFIIPALILFMNSTRKTQAEINDSKNIVPSGVADQNSKKPRIFFEQNRGQQNQRVNFFTRNADYELFLTATDAVYVIPEKISDSNDKKNRAVALFMKLNGANSDSQSTGIGELPGKTNYLIGKDSAKWRTDIPTFSGVQNKNVYDGIDVLWHSNENNEIQYDFLVAPNADSRQIEWKIEGAKSVNIDSNGDLLISTEFGELRQKKPVSFQVGNSLRSEVESHFEKRGENVVGFTVPNYDKNKLLIIDPAVTLNNLAFSTFLGGSLDDNGFDIVTDSAGNVYVTGFTESPLFPTTSGTIDRTFNANNDVFVTKLNSSATELIYSTYIGGSGSDEGRSIVLDASNNVYITGVTTSTTFPTTVGALDVTSNGSSDGFVSKINPTGSAFVYSTYLGGNAADEPFGIAIDNTNNVYVTGRTSGGTFPVSVGAIDPSFNGVNDVFVSKIDPAGANLVYSTFLGGDNLDYGQGIAVDSGGNAYITGYSANGTTVDYPTTAGAFQINYQGGGTDIIVSKINSAGSALSYSTFIGGTDEDSARDIAVDSTGSAYIVGSVINGGGFPVTLGAYDITHNGGIDTVVSKLNPQATSLTFSTFIGGTSTDLGNSISVDSLGSVYITGSTLSGATNYPTLGAFDSTHNGGQDVYVTRFNPAGNALLYSTFIGGLANDSGLGITTDQSGNVFVTGFSTSTATTPFPTTVDAYQSFYAGDQDAFVSKLGDYLISGRTIDTSGLPLSNTAVGMSGSRSDFMLSDAQGYFGFSDTINGGSFTVSAVNNAYNFTPNTFTLNPFFGNNELNFIGRPIASGPTVAFGDIGGEVNSIVGNRPLPNTSLTLIDPSNPGNLRTVSTDSSGEYNFQEIPLGRFYIVFAQRNGFNFEPNQYSLVYLDNLSNVDFLATPNAPRPVDDFDGDGKSDIAVFRPDDGNWYILNSENNNLSVFRFGLNGDIPVSNDFDGDNINDLAVFRPSSGIWYWIESSSGSFHSVKFGISEDKPIPADFDGDGKTDLCVFRPSSGVWHRLNSSDGQYSAIKFGISEDIPINGDYDGDGKSDITVYRPSTGNWFRLNSSDSQLNVMQFGISEDKPIPADFDGDGKFDIAVFRPSNGNWYFYGSLNGNVETQHFGQNGDIPIVSDFDGDGRFEKGVFRNGTWYVLKNDGNYFTVQFGQNGDIPISAKNR